MEKDKKIKLLGIVGPTACGKTELSINIAKKMNAEIISADSMQIYKNMNIATAKPTKKQLSEVTHYLIDFLEIYEQFNVAKYTNLVHNYIKEIYSKNKLPIICGGTGLYISSVIDNIQYDKIKTDYNLRKKLNEQINNEGTSSLLKELYEIDRETAEKLHSNNKRKIIRAIEVYRTTGKTITEHNKNSRKSPQIYNSYIIGLKFKDRNLLYERINNRVDKMLEEGLLEEAKEILNTKYIKTAMGAIGYKELLPFFKNECSLEEAIIKLKQSTRRYAKRQLTWFNARKDINWINLDDFDDFSGVIKKAESLIKDWYNGVF